MTLFITSCGRHDLLKKTLSSFFLNQKSDRISGVVIHEDSKNPNVDAFTQIGVEFNAQIIYTNGIGQHASIEKFLLNTKDYYYIHCEDDWEFDNSYDWIEESVNVFLQQDDIVKVLIRKDSPHPCIYDQKSWGYVRPWINDGIIWKGFSWNPGLTKTYLLRQCLPFCKFEQDVATTVFNLGLKIAALEIGIVSHIGDGRSTHN